MAEFDLVLVLKELWKFLEFHSDTIIGIGVSTFGVILTGFLYNKVKNIEKDRRKEQTQHFKKLVVSNVEEVLQIYQTASKLSHRETRTSEETHNKTIELYDFFKKKQDIILGLIRDTKFYASMLSIIDAPSIDTNEIIDKIKWLPEEFYILDYPIERNERHWIMKENELRKNRDFIENSLTLLYNL